MTEIKSEGGHSHSYTIPLDSIDLKYLSKFVRTPHAEKRPLWTRKCLDEKSKYCHVQIVAQDDNADCYSEETFDTYNCHICNVEVPVLCFNKHNESEKHVTLKSIFLKVFERVTKQINISVINNDKCIDKDVYYCVACSKIIKIENKHKHESSAYHVISERGIKVVHEFYKIFEENKAFVGVKEVENDEILDENRDLSANKFGTEIIQNDTKNNNVKHVTNEDKYNNDETKTLCATNDNTMKPTCSVEHVVPNDKLNGVSEENDFKDMVKKYNLKVNLPIVDGEFIHVATPSGVKVKISRDHFHSYLTMVRGIRVYCQMCNEPVDFGEESKHKVSEKHARNVFLPVNEQFARTFNKFSYHCLICNTVFTTKFPTRHYLDNDYHDTLLNSAKLTDICQNNEDLSNGINTENNIERTHSEKHIIENHVNKSEENKIQNSGDHHNESHIARTRDATSVQKLVFCKLCNVSVPQDQIEYHNAGTPHWSNAFKNICTDVADGLQAYFFKDNPKTDSNSPKKQYDISKNYNITYQNETPKNCNLTNQNDSLKNDEPMKCNKNYVPKNYNLGKQNDVLMKCTKNYVPKNYNLAKQNDVPMKCTEIDVLKNDNVAKQNDALKNDNVTNQNDSLKNDNVTNQNDSLKNDNVTNQNDSLRNDNVTNQNDSLKNDNVTNQNDSLKNDNLTNQNDIYIVMIGYIIIFRSLFFLATLSFLDIIISKL